MNGFNFTERIRRVLILARDASNELNHEYVGTEHLLLGLINEGGGVAGATLQNLQINSEELKRGIGDIVRRGKTTDPPVDLPYTSRAKKVLELSMAEARDFNHNYVGTEHLLLGLIREEKGIAAQVLTQAGLKLEMVREEIARLLGQAPPRVSSGPTSHLSSTIYSSSGPGTIASGVTIGLWFGNGSQLHRGFRDIGEAIEFLKGHEKDFPKT